jgi:hypothetical protein
MGRVGAKLLEELLAGQIGREVAGVPEVQRERRERRRQQPCGKIAAAVGDDVEPGGGVRRSRSLVMASS